MKKSISILVVALAISLFLTLPASAGSVFDSIIKRGELRVGTSGQQPPMTAISKDGRIIGFDSDISNAIATAMGVEVTFNVMPFNELLTALKDGRVDMVISGMTMTPKRNMNFAFVGPYHVSGKGILAKAKKYTELREAGGLNTPKVRIAALINSTSQEYVEELMPKAELTATNSYDEAIDLLLDAKVDILVADYPFCALTAYRYHDKDLFVGESPLTFEPLGIALPEDTLLINWVRNFLFTINSNGELKKIQSKWLNGGKWVDQLP